MVNATGWSQLMDGHLISASFIMYDTALVGWTVAILFFVYQFMLYLKTRNLTLCWVSGLFFASLYAASTIFKSVSLHIMFVLLVFELAGIFFLWLFKN